LTEPPDAPMPQPLPLPPPPPPPPPASWQASGYAPAPWLPPALARLPLTALFAVAMVVQFVAAAVAGLVLLAALLAGLGIRRFGLLEVGVSFALCLVHSVCGSLALRRWRPAVWAGYALLVVEALVFAALFVG